MEGDIGEEGMIMDFVILKRTLKKIIDEVDHRTLLPARSKEVKIDVEGDSVEVVSGCKRYVFPKEDVALLDVPTTTAEEMCKMMTLRMKSEIDFPPNVRSISIGLDEERGQTAWYTEALR
jgi:6-pyruvoyltetrahydropterin/6-carboxytetrahydropterin synthase